VWEGDIGVSGSYLFVLGLIFLLLDILHHHGRRERREKTVTNQSCFYFSVTGFSFLIPHHDEMFGFWRGAVMAWHFERAGGLAWMGWMDEWMVRRRRRRDTGKEGGNERHEQIGWGRPASLRWLADLFSGHDISDRGIFRARNGREGGERKGASEGIAMTWMRASF
jgi:hypothetical protein